MYRRIDYIAPEVTTLAYFCKVISAQRRGVCKVISARRRGVSYKCTTPQKRWLFRSKKGGVILIAAHHKKGGLETSLSKDNATPLPFNQLSSVALPVNTAQKYLRGGVFSRVDSV